VVLSKIATSLTQIRGGSKSRVVRDLSQQLVYRLKRSIGYAMAAHARGLIRFEPWINTMDLECYGTVR
jgi:hypothetical protein